MTNASGPGNTQRTGAADTGDTPQLGALGHGAGGLTE